jgi:hypothetical protein
MAAGEDKTQPNNREVNERVSGIRRRNQAADARSVSVRSQSPAPTRLRPGNNRALNRTLAGEARLAQIAHLQAQIGQLRQEKTKLEGHLAGKIAEAKLLSTRANRFSNQLEAWRRRADRERNLQFSALRQRLSAAYGNFDTYAASVNDNPTRLFALGLLAELQASDVGSDVLGHAEQIVDLFDPFYYLGEHQDVALAGTNPLYHYVTTGFEERRRPNLLFEPDFYCAQDGEIRGDPLLHYAQTGARAGLWPHPLFDGAYYLEKNRDIRDSGVNPLFHYQVWGCLENRDPLLLFDTEYFLAQEGDSPSLTGVPLHDYLLRGAEAADPHALFANRWVQQQLPPEWSFVPPLLAYETAPDLWPTIRPHPLFDLGYLTEIGGVSFPDNYSPLHYYCQLLERYDIDPCVLFDSALYRYQVEVEQKEILTEPPIIDYLKHGYENKNLVPNVLFDPAAYLSRNRIDVSGAELVHYYLVGDRKGYYCHELFSSGTYNAGRIDNEPITALEHFLLAPEEALV